MAPKTRRSGGSNGQQRAASTPAIEPEAVVAEAGPSSGRVYRSGRAPQQQQVRFPGRRKIVKKYGRQDPARSPIQRTLTQIGYAMPPLSGLHEVDSLDDPEGGSSVDDMASTAQDISFSGTATTTSALVPRGSKRRKVSQTIKETSSASSSFHTQTLTQFVAKEKANGGQDDASDDDDDNYGFDATIRDSEDEFSLESPIAKPDVSKNIPTGKELTATPTKPRRKDVVLSTAKATFSTPKARRTEIPSSQPSPFTPLLLLGRYHSPLGKQRSSPLSGKGNGQAMPIPDMDASPSHRRSMFPKRVVPDSFSTTNSASQGKTPLRTLNPREVAERSMPRESSELRGVVIEASPSLSVRDVGRTVSLTPGLQGRAARSSQEIPDSDDEDGGFSVPLNRERKAVSTAEAVNAARDGPPAIEETFSSAPTSPLSSPSISEPESPTPLPKKRSRDVDEISIHNHGVVNHDAAVPDEGSAEEPGSSQANDTQMYSQAMESQRVPLQVIRSLGPQTYESDIIISIHPEQVKKIISGVKDHEFRGYRIPGTVTRLWIYTTQPVCELRYMALINPGFLEPGEIDSESGLGNAAFNAGQLVVKFAYKINQVYQLNNPVSIDLMKRNGWVDGPPQRYVFVPPAVVGALLGNLQRALLTKGPEYELSVSQEIDAQLLGDIADTQVSQQDQPSTSVALLDSSTTGQLPGSSPSQHAPQHIHMPPPGRQARPASQREDKASEPVTIWPSQATTATSPASQEEQAVKETAGTTIVHGSQSQYASSPIDCSAVIPRPEVDFDQSSILSVKDGMGRTYDSQTSEHSPQLSQMTRGPQTRRLQRQRSALRNALASSNESTQIVLPDSLYDEVRQAPPAVILDSEDSDDG